jgi:hypothetical protein
VSTAKTIEARTQLATEMSGAFTVSQLGLHAGIEGSARLASDVCHLFARLGLAPLTVPDNLGGVMQASAASAFSRGLTEYARRGAMRAADSPESWAPAAGVILGASEMPHGATRDDAVEIRSIREQSQQIADALTALGPRAVSDAARSVATTPNPTPSPQGAAVILAGALAALAGTLPSGTRL